MPGTHLGAMTDGSDLFQTDPCLSHLDDAGVAAAVVVDPIRTIAISRTWARELGHFSAEGSSVIGTTGGALFMRGARVPQLVAEERVNLMREVVATGKKANLLGFGMGRLEVMTFKPMPAVCEAPGALLIRRPISSREDYQHVLGEPCTRKAFANWARGLGTSSIRELQVLRLVGLGMSTTQIAKTLFRSEKTIESHIAALNRKLNASSRLALARSATFSGLIWLENDEIEEWWSRSMITNAEEAAGN
ncbi:MAG TPA: helix-turn-helix transcriptional regulator [Phycisphaerales bacterium]|nr:helix-turn-helix transcriptional regulator [Phycisphaerales bacterium]